MSGGPTVPTVRWSGDAYGANNAHHRTFDQDLLSSLDLRGDEQLLDLGCGSGEFSRRLASVVLHGEVVGVDADPDMVRAAAAGENPANLRVEQVAAQDVADRLGSAVFDGVVSIAVLHWVPASDQVRVAQAVRQVLRPGGWFRADFGGVGQIAQARALLDDVVVRFGGRPASWYFPSAEEHGEVLTAAGFDLSSGWIERREQRRPFDLDGVRGWVASQVSIAYLPSVPPEKHEGFLNAVNTEVVPALRRDDGSYDQDYVRIDLFVRAS